MLPSLDHDPGLTELRLLDRRLTAHVERMDARVDQLLATPGLLTAADTTEIDVLCAAIGEVRELIDDARHDAALEVMLRRLRAA